MYKVVLWGAGEGYNLFSSLQGHRMVDVKAIVDSNMWKYYKNIDGIPVVEPKELVSSVSFDYLIICVQNEEFYKEIIAEAGALGIKREVILPVRIFQIPFFDFDEYIKIKESNISILSDYCFAGFLYHKFGMRFNSPTIKMFTDNESYLKFLKNINGYLATPMVEVENVVDKAYCGIYSHLRGKVGDIEWLFPHDICYETACERWKKGAERFNYDNYMTIMTIRSDEAAYEFDALDIKNKIGFYWKDLGLDSVVYIPEWNIPEVRKKFYNDFSSLVNMVAREDQGIRYINWMRALQHKDDYKRINK